jgi:SAM-dependent methyltransferase
MNVASIIANTIDTERFAEIAARYGSAVSPERREKYLDLERWIGVSIERVQRVGLDSGPRRRILDLGCGCGYFLYVCKLLGHEVLGVDVPEQRSMYTEIRELLGVPWAPHAIAPFEPLPVVGPFDVMTAHMVTFNGHRTANVWGPREWDWLLGHIGAPLVYLELNAELEGPQYPHGIREHFELIGAKVQQHRVLIDRR